MKTKVEVLDKTNEAAKKIKGQGEGSASERTRTTITAGLKKKLKVRGMGGCKVQTADVHCKGDVMHCVVCVRMQQEVVC